MCTVGRTCEFPEVVELKHKKENKTRIIYTPEKHRMQQFFNHKLPWIFSDKIARSHIDIMICSVYIEVT